MGKKLNCIFEGDGSNEKSIYVCDENFYLYW